MVPVQQASNACARSVSRLQCWWHDENGQGVTEYAVIMSMVVLITLAGVSAISGQALDTLRKVVAALR
jgi:Flp pilus assembly pilin Flp